MAQVCVLGGGLVGRFVAINLDSRGHAVRLVDSQPLSDVPSNIEVVQTMIGAASIRHLVQGCEVVVNCLPGRFAHAVRTPLLSIEGMKVADLAFTAEDPRELNALAQQHGSRMIFDVGIAPGLSNILLLDASAKLKGLKAAKVWVGGNPQQPDENWSYMAPFSPTDVIEEYTRPARIRRDGAIVIEPALAERHAVEVPGYGEMEAFLTDGLRSLLDTLDCADLSEYTVRWPGHIEKFIAGDFSDHELIEAWRFDPARPEFTWLAVETTNHDDVKMHWQILDEGGDGDSSMARTTGLVCVDVVEMLAEGLIEETGVMPPEFLATKPDALKRILASFYVAGIRVDT